jgi:ubiquinone/menaquinone biosynthesis C-methylase UbiE
LQDYARYRPYYPAAVIGSLQTNCQLLETSVIADVGSGTGILTELFLRHGNRCSPWNRTGRCGKLASGCWRATRISRALPGRAEATTLPEQSVDFVTAGQAFHWFDRKKAKAEFSRILKARGWVVFGLE